MIEEEVDFITSYLGKELKFFFKPFDKEIRKMQDEEKELLDKWVYFFNGTIYFL